MRPVRCVKCKSRFYTAVATNTCQNCEGTHDQFEGAKRDAEQIKKVTRVHRTSKPQAVDPRTGLGAGEVNKENAE